MDTSDHELELALLTTLPGDGTPIGNTTILRQLGWDEPTYFRIRDGLTAIGSVRLGRGRGGAVARVAGVTTLAKAFLDTLPVDGSPVGNIALQRQLSWDDEIYRAVKESLVDAGITKTGRGYGGTVSLATSPSVEILEELGPPPNGDVTEMSAVPRRELDLYPSFEESLNNWARAQEWNDHIVRQVANQGRRATGGVWTRPDFVVIGYKKWGLHSWHRSGCRDIRTETCGLWSRGCVRNRGTLKVRNQELPRH